MDPNALLFELIELAKKNLESDNDTLSDISEKILNLDEWISKGGCLPEPWSQKKIEIRVKKWLDKKNGGNYVQISYSFNGVSKTLPTDSMGDDNNNYLSVVLADIGGGIGFYQNQNHTYPHPTIFCRENNIFYSITSDSVKKRDIMK